jgi:predicted O-methyltransferase YrrM
MRAERKSGPPEELLRIYTAYRQATVLITANRLRIFDSLAEKPATAGQLARRNKLDERALEILLDALAALGLLSKRSSIYRCTAIARTHLVSGKPEFIGHLIDHHHNMLQNWALLPEVVEKGGPARTRRRKRTPREHSDFIHAMADIGRTSAWSLLDRLDLSRYRRMLDIGGGPGMYAIAACMSQPELNAVVYDLPETIPIARDVIARYGMENRIETMAGDFLKCSLGTGYDLVLVSNIVHSLGPKDIRTLLAKAYRSMTTGGLIIIKDFLLDDSRTRPVESALFAVNMLIATSTGNCYTATEIKGALRNAGFVAISSRRVPRYSCLYLGRKR